MLRSILIGLDSSASGIAAQVTGIRWAQELDCRLTGVTIVDNPGFPFGEEQDLGGTPDRGCGPVLTVEPGLQVAAGLRAVEDAFGRRCREAGVDYQLIEEVGSPHVQILLEAQQHDVVLLGQRSHFEFGWEGEPGETLARVLRDSPRPVVVVPAPPRPGPWPGPGTSIAAAYDGSPQAARALASFATSGLGRGRMIHVIATTSAADHLHAARHAERAIVFLNHHELHAMSHVVESTRPPAEVILEKARLLDAGLLVMGAFGKAAFTELFVGSVTSTVLRESPIPVYCYL
jgi:nucleotide-binding universal stress UspA family protein